METKALRVEIKSEDEGIVKARFATLGVKDKDGDIIEAGAFGEQEVRVSAYQHASWGGALPVGTGRISEDGKQAVADLNFFMNTTHGRDHFETIKGLGKLGEWSFGFDVLEEAAPSEEQASIGVARVLKKLKVHEVSPVLLGAGVDTETLAVKGKKDGEGDEGTDPPVEPEGSKGGEDPDKELKEAIAAEFGRAELLMAKAGGLE